MRIDANGVDSISGGHVTLKVLILSEIPTRLLEVALV